MNIVKEIEFKTGLTDNGLSFFFGIDQETITEAITKFAENGEKVKLQEKEIDDLSKK